MNWINETTEKYADSYTKCPVTNRENRLYDTKNEKTWHLSTELRRHYLDRAQNHSSSFIKYIVREAYTLIDWNQLADYWGEEYFSSQKETQLQLL
jgi:hypothetical protein